MPMPTYKTKQVTKLMTVKKGVVLINKNFFYEEVVVYRI